MQDVKNGRVCSIAGCGRDTYNGARGVCMNHYSVFHNRVKRGVTTWDELEIQGLVGPLSIRKAKKINALPNTLEDASSQLLILRAKKKFLEDREKELTNLIDSFAKNDF